MSKSKLKTLSSLTTAKREVIKAVETSLIQFGGVLPFAAHIALLSKVLVSDDVVIARSESTIDVVPVISVNIGSVHA